MPCTHPRRRLEKAPPDAVYRPTPQLLHRLKHLLPLLLLLLLPHACTAHRPASMHTLHTRPRSRPAPSAPWIGGGVSEEIRGVVHQRVEECSGPPPRVA